MEVREYLRDQGLVTSIITIFGGVEDGLPMDDQPEIARPKLSYDKVRCGLRFQNLFD